MCKSVLSQRPCEGRQHPPGSDFFGQRDDFVLYVQHPLVGDLLLVADEHRLPRSSYLAPSGRRNSPPFRYKGTEFQQKVYQFIQEVPLGATTSYTELTARLKMPRAARAVGAAISKNPLLIFIPDHRVVNSNGSVGGFAGKAFPRHFVPGYDRLSLRDSWASKPFI